MGSVPSRSAGRILACKRARDGPLPWTFVLSGSPLIYTIRCLPDTYLGTSTGRWNSLDSEIAQAPKMEGWPQARRLNPGETEGHLWTLHGFPIVGDAGEVAFEQGIVGALPSHTDPRARSSEGGAFDIE